jgi:hypothetical protein
MEVIRDPRGVVVVLGAVRRALTIAGAWVLLLEAAKNSSATTQTENITHFQRCAVSKCTVRMLSGWVLATD